MAANDQTPCNSPVLKQPQMECIIHCTNDEGQLFSVQSFKSWSSLIRAARIQKHAPLLELARNTKGQIPKIFYHRKCRSIFTMKRDLERKKRKNMSQCVETNFKRIACQTSSASKTFGEVCIFCEKKNKCLKGQNKKDALVECKKMQANTKIRSAAKKKKDRRILAIMRRDLVAAERYYHRSCYRMYTKEKVLKEGVTSIEDLCSASQYKAAVNTAYTDLFHYIRVELFGNPQVVKMTSLASMLATFINSQGIIHIKESTMKHLRRKLEYEFAGELQFISEENGKLIVYPANLTVQQLARENQSLKNELQALKSAYTPDAMLCKIALQLRQHIQSQDPQPWPPNVKESEEAVIPDLLYVFLYNLLGGSNDQDHASAKVRRLVQSFGQDFVYAVSHGRIKPSKHIALPFSVKSLTGNVELINILNRLGHCISYTQMQEIDTALSLKKLSSDTALPSNIYPKTFTTLVWDNIDRLEETCSGGGTSHRVNGIAVQSKTVTSFSPPSLPPIAKTKKRSIDSVLSMLPIYDAGQRVGPPQSKTAVVNSFASAQSARMKNLIWVAARMSQPIDQEVNSWTGFNIKTRNEMAIVPDNIGYLPTINGPATQMTTVNEILTQSLNIMQHLCLKKVVCVFDQALYAKAVEITWKHHQKFQDIIIRLGVFHTICTLLAIIGKRFRDAGLADLCIESGIIAEGSVAGVMDGRKYNRAVRFHKLVYEALMRLAWKGFLSWLQEKHAGETIHLTNALMTITSLGKDVSQSSLEKVLDSSSCQHITDLFEIYRQFLRVENGQLSAFWMSYLDMAEILLGLIRASREGDWLLHMASIRALIPWCFAYDRTNYARYLPYYYSQMSQLHIINPDVYSEFMKGGFSVQLGSTNPFGRIPFDQAIEETVNKDTQTAGGTKGFSLKPGAVAKYYLTAEYRSMYLRQLRDISGLSKSTMSHPDLHNTRIKKDEADVQTLIDLMENRWLNPLSGVETDLVNLSTGSLALPDVTSDLLKAQVIGEEAYQLFKKTRLDQNPPSLKFYEKMPKQNLKTFSNSKTKIGKKVHNMVLKADIKLFSHMILVAQSRKVNMRDVLSHPLGPVPWSLANADGSLRKTNKAVLARELEKSVSPVEQFPSPTASVLDGMSLIQKMNGNNKSFAQVADTAFTHILHEGAQSERIDVVFDVYRECSIKNAERLNRGADSAIQYKHITGGHHIQQWRKFLCSPTNKTSLIKFLVEEWKQQRFRKYLHGKVMYVTCEESCFKLTQRAWEEVGELNSSHEEADTRLLLHTLHAAKTGSKAVIITAEDTDIMVLCLSFQKHIPCPIYQKCGTQNNKRFIDIAKLSLLLGENVCDSLIGLHSFTGCDTVSAFAGKGKLHAFKILIKNPSWQNIFSELGLSWDLKEGLFKKIEEFTCEMYLPNTSIVDVNEARYCLFCKKRGELSSSQIPPCRDCLFMHTLRANFQAAIWRRSLQAKPVIPSPAKHGWTTDDDKLVIHWMRSLPAPDQVLELMACKCIRSCKVPSCTCLMNGLKCTDMCKLKSCSNQHLEDDEETEPGILQGESSDDENDEE